MIGMSVCLTMTAFYMVWSVAVSRVMERIEGAGGVWSKMEMLGGTITCAPIMTGVCYLAHRRARDRQHQSRYGAHALLVWVGS